MSSTIKTTDLRLIEFPAGYLRAYRANSDKHIAWVRRYTMIIPKSRGGVTFGDGDFKNGLADLSAPFTKAALRRCFELALELAPEEGMHDFRTDIRIRRVGKGAVFELVMPCGETACVKKSVLARLAKELESV